MPQPLKIDLTRVKLSDDERAIVEEALLTDGSLRASKPEKASGRGKYVWRMLVFTLSATARHHCLPVTADLDLYRELQDHDATRAEAKRLDVLVDRVINTVPVTEQPGTMRWVGVFGDARAMARRSEAAGKPIKTVS